MCRRFSLPKSELNLNPDNYLEAIKRQNVTEDNFKKHYREDFGRPAKPIRLM